MANLNRNILAGACLLFAAGHSLLAQNNTAEIFGGYSYAKANPEVPLPKQNMHGWVGSVSGYANSWFGAGIEIAGQFGTLPPPSGVSAPDLSFKEYSYMAGPQFRFLNMKKVQSNVKILIGGAFGQVNPDSKTSATEFQALGAVGYNGFNQTKFAALFAVPVDIAVNRLIALRVEPGLYLTDFVKTKQGNFRFSVGPVFRFGAR
jgi:hypothetical protein